MNGPIVSFLIGAYDQSGKELHKLKGGIMKFYGFQLEFINFSKISHHHIFETKLQYEPT